MAPVQQKMTAEDWLAAGLGLLALALGVGAVAGLVRPGGEEAAGNVPVLAFASLLAGLVAIFVARTKGMGRRLAVIGCAAGLVAVVLFGGFVAVESLSVR